MKRFLLKLFAVVILCTGLIFALAYLPDVGQRISSWNAKKIIKTTDETISNSFAGPVYLSAKDGIADEIEKKKEEITVTYIDDTPAAFQPALVQVELVRVVDGDTIYVKDETGTEEYIRLCGINCCESVAPEDYLEESGKSNNDFGTAASEHTKSILSEYEYVYLEYDTELMDEYGRILAYVWLVDNTYDIKECLNAKLIDDGFAKVMTIEPNTKYKNTFVQMESDAKDNKRGLWYYPDFESTL